MQCINDKRKFDVTGQKYNRGLISGLLRKSGKNGGGSLGHPVSPAVCMGDRGPKMALPMRTCVAPQRMAWT